MTAVRARLGVEAPKETPEIAAKVLGHLFARGKRSGKFALSEAHAPAFRIAEALGVSLETIAPSLAWAEAHGLADASTKWSLTDRGRQWLLDRAAERAHRGGAP